MPERLVSAMVPGEVIPQWRPFVADGRAGAFAYFAGKTLTPKLEFKVLRIDFIEPGIQIVVRGGGKGKVLSTRVSSFVRDNGLIAGINATPFDPASAKEGEPRTNVGIVVSDGIMISPPNPRFDALVWYADSGPVIVPQAELDNADNIVNAVGGFHRILKAGELTERALKSRPRYPRSAVGISTDGVSAEVRFLYLLVIDGGRPGSAGATEAETALLLRALGASEGINLDGGGSSALALRYPDGSVRVVNTPVHGGVSGRERAVAGCLGIGLRE
ncbi:MAG: phosphodiester glycosidase family protein [Treponema sp.]|jgi:exopolysaccharide biosynthesis protein|nr:phosphodiester glycosidase family protein [Treponema sp.]